MFPLARQQKCKYDEKKIHTEQTQVALKSIFFLYLVYLVCFLYL